MGSDQRTRRARALPLEEFSQEHQDHIAWLVAQPKPPPRWLSFGGLCQMESRAWYEWHWQRGMDSGERRAVIAAALRLRVYERDGHLCVICASGFDLTLDHIYPYSLGGEDAYENLQTMCRPCNSRKGARV